MHTYEVTFTDGSMETYCSERIQFGPTHIVFDNTADSLGCDSYGNYRHSLEAAVLASIVLSITEVNGATWGRRLKDEAWDECASAAGDLEGDLKNLNPYREKK